MTWGTQWVPSISRATVGRDHAHDTDFSPPKAFLITTLKRVKCFPYRHGHLQGLKAKPLFGKTKPASQQPHELMVWVSLGLMLP